MSSKLPPYFLVSESVRQSAIRLLLSLPIDADKPFVMQIKAKTRSLEQSAKLHAMFGELAIKAKWNGEQLTPEQWKVLMISAHTIATGEPCKLTVGIEGEMVNLRESSAKMSISRMASCIEYVQAWAAQNNVVFRE
jgi:hypothetical protein